MTFTLEEKTALSVLDKLDLPQYRLTRILAHKDYLGDVHSKELVDFLLAINTYYLAQDDLNLSAYNLKHLQRIVRERLDLETSRLDKTVRTADYATGAAFVAIPAAQLALIVAQVICPPLAPALNIAWGGTSGVGIIPTTVDQFKQGEYVLGTTTATTTTGLIGGSVMSGIIEFSPATLGIGAGISASVAAGILSFAAAAAMLAAAMSALSEASKSDALVGKLEEQLGKLQATYRRISGTNEKALEENLAEQTQLKNLIALEKANGDNHRKNAASWGLCSAIMIGVGVVALLSVLGVVSAGIIPLVVAAAAGAVAAIRWYTTTQIDYVKQLEQSNLQERLTHVNPTGGSHYPSLSPKTPTIPIRLVDAGDDGGVFDDALKNGTIRPKLAKEQRPVLDMADETPKKKKPLNIPSNFRAYISELIQKDVKKATRVICAIEEGNEKRLKDALDIRRHSFFQPEKTEGTKIYEESSKDSLVKKLEF